MYCNGKPKPFTPLVDAYQAPVYTLCSLLLGVGPAAEEAAQECFAQAYTQFNGHCSTQNTQTWLLHLAYQQCKAGGFLPDDQNNRAGARGAQISTGKDASLQSLLAGLEPEDRAVIALSYWYQLELPDIARVVGMDCEMVNSRLRNAQKTLLAQVCQTNKMGTGSDLPVFL